MKQFFKGLFLRLSMETPQFFLKIRTLCATITLVCTALLEQGVDFEIFGYSIGKILAIATACGTLITFFAVKDNEELNNKLKSKDQP